jgi:hypothetical protein
VVPRAGLDVLKRRKLLFLLGFEPRLHGLPARSVVTIPTEIFYGNVGILSYFQDINLIIFTGQF